MHDKKEHCIILQHTSQINIPSSDLDGILKVFLHGIYFQLFPQKQKEPVPLL